MSNATVTITKGELQKIRTKNNKLLKCINEINYATNHIKTKPYDYGEAYESAIADIKERTIQCINQIKELDN